MAETHQTFCRICESLCGLNVTTQDNQVTQITPDKDHVATRGFACPKGLKQHKLYSSPDRLTQPRIRGTNSEPWRTVGWDEALSFTGTQLRQIIDTHGPDAVGMYVGTAAGFGTLHPMFAQGFMDGIGSRNLFASATQDCANKFAVAERMYGFPFTQPFPDLQNMECLIIVGANPMVSKWSFLQVPNPRKHINQIRERGGRVIVVDPRNTETAKASGEHVFIQPGSDVFFYLAFLQEVVNCGGIKQAHVDAHMQGLDTVLALSKDWTCEKAAQFTGIHPDTMRELVQAYLSAQGAGLYCSTGVNMGPDGTLAFYLQEIINAVTGNLDKRGGMVVGTGIFDFARFGKKHNLLTKQDRSRIGGFRKTNDAFPGGILADEILTPGQGQIRALIVTGGNPLLTMADGEKLKSAFSELELLICLDILPTETANAGHVTLPCTTPLERPDLPFIFPLFLGMQTKPYLQATNSVLDPPGQVRDEATIYVDLANHTKKPLFGSKVLQSLLNLTRSKAPGSSYRAVAQRGILSLLLRITGQGGFNKYLGHGLLRPANTGDTLLGKRVYTRKDNPEAGDGAVQLAPEELVSALQNRLKQAIPQNTQPDEFRLITKRHVETHNSWTHNLSDFMDRLGGRNAIHMHSEDAERLQLSEGDIVDVTSSAGQIRLPVTLCDDLLMGVVAVPHGWGHQDSGNQIASASAGVNVNILASSGVDHIDRVSGMSQLTSLIVRVNKATSDTTGSSWSGLPASAG